MDKTNNLATAMKDMSDMMTQMFSFTFTIMGLLIFIVSIFKMYNYAKSGRDLGGVIPMFFAGILLFSLPNLFPSTSVETTTQNKPNIVVEKNQPVKQPDIVNQNLNKKDTVAEYVKKEVKYAKKEVDINWKALITIFGSIIGFILFTIIIVCLITTISYFILKRKTLNFINIETNLLNVADNIVLITEQIKYNKKYIDNKILFQNKVENLNEKLKIKYDSIEKYLLEQESKLIS